MMIDRDAQYAEKISLLDSMEKDLLLTVLIAIQEGEPGSGERLEQYYKWLGGLTIEQRATLPHEDHKRLLSALVRGEPLSDELRHHWKGAKWWTK